MLNSCSIYASENRYEKTKSMHVMVRSSWGGGRRSTVKQHSLVRSDKKVMDNYVEDRLVACVNSEALQRYEQEVMSKIIIEAGCLPRSVF